MLLLEMYLWTRFIRCLFVMIEEWCQFFYRDDFAVENGFYIIVIVFFIAKMRLQLCLSILSIFLAWRLIYFLMCCSLSKCVYSFCVILKYPFCRYYLFISLILLLLIYIYFNFRHDIDIISNVLIIWVLLQIILKRINQNIWYCN